MEKFILFAPLVASIIAGFGWPILTPSALASLLRAMAQPSLLDKTTTGRPMRSGWKARSQLA